MFILEYVRTIDENGKRIAITEDSQYTRYGNMTYNNREDAEQDRVQFMWGADNIYIRVKEVNEN